MIQSGILENQPKKFKNVAGRSKILTIEKMEGIIFRYWNTAFSMSYWSFCYLVIFGPANHIFELFRFVFEDSTPNHVWGTYKLVFQCKKFVFGEIDLLFWNFPWFGLCLAFLASMASKTKTLLKPDLLLPYDLRYVEKLLKFVIFQLWPLLWPSKNFWPFYNFPSHFKV